MPTMPKEYMRQHRINNPINSMINKARKNAKKANLPFELSCENLTMPERCPVLGIVLQVGEWERQQNSPSLDRYDSSKGYVKGNVNVISWRANHLKNNGTLEEFRNIVRWMEAEEASRASLA